MDTEPHTHEVRSSDGTQIGVTTFGSGPPLVFVHGAWNWAEHWLGVAEELADAHTCSVMDRRGRANSADGGDYSFEHEIDDIAAVLSTAGRSASLLGHSSGAIYALETARRVSLDGLVLYEPPLRWAERGDPTRLVDRIRELVDENRLDEAAELFFGEEGRLPGRRRSVEDDAGLGSDGAIGTDLRARVGRHPRRPTQRRPVPRSLDPHIASCR